MVKKVPEKPPKENPPNPPKPPPTPPKHFILTVWPRSEADEKMNVTGRLTGKNGLDGVLNALAPVLTVERLPEQALIGENREPILFLEVFDINAE